MELILLIIAVLLAVGLFGVRRVTGAFFVVLAVPVAVFALAGLALAAIESVSAYGVWNVVQFSGVALFLLLVLVKGSADCNKIAKEAEDAARKAACPVSGPFVDAVEHP